MLESGHVTNEASSRDATRKRGRLYRYYISSTLLRTGLDDCLIRRVPAEEIETAVIGQVRALLQTPEIIVATWRKAKQAIKGLTEAQVREALHGFDELWSELFPAEQARIIQLLVERVEISTSGAAITLRTEGLASLIQDISQRGELAKEAA